VQTASISSHPFRVGIKRCLQDREYIQGMLVTMVDGSVVFGGKTMGDNYGKEAPTL
jgi:hypothetical protein